MNVKGHKTPKFNNYETEEHFMADPSFRKYVEEYDDTTFNTKLGHLKLKYELITELPKRKTKDHNKNSNINI